MNISRFEPFSLLSVLQREADELAARRLGPTSSNLAGESLSDWLPPVDIVEETDRFVLRADLPGVKPDDIEISMDKSVLSLSGKRAREVREESDSVKLVERTSGSFHRRFALPETANADEISAVSTDGILEVIIPKQAEVKARRITVKAA
ncbi:MAG: Hsp20/alpha crystallin family protein [Woeseiaceae bacterium]